jgi:hypothetical protein
MGAFNDAVRAMGYSKIEEACKGCFGPCGRCHELYDGPFDLPSLVLEAELEDNSGRPSVVNQKAIP